MLKRAGKAGKHLHEFRVQLDLLPRRGGASGLICPVKAGLVGAALSHVGHASILPASYPPEPMSVPRALAAVHMQNFARHKAG